MLTNPLTYMPRGDESRPLRGGPVQPRTSALRPLDSTEIRLTGGFWSDKVALNSTVILDHCESWMESVGWTSNFDRAAEGTVATEHAGIEFVDSEIYKLLEAMAWELGRSGDAALASRYARLAARVASAQEPDGYLHTSFGREGQPARYSNLEWGHELYCFGHLIQAAVARLRSGFDDELPAIARRLADHVYEVFGPTGRVAVCGHPEIEVALAEFGRATGDARYLELARIFVERRGTGTLGAIQHGPEYFQDDMPVRDATVLRGHSVRALYLAAGALDVAVDSDDTELRNAVATQWSNTVARRTYITGGMGSHHQDEGFGEDYELPADRAYSETCAGIASVMLSWRLLLDDGDPRYADLIERTLLNNVLASPRADGKAFYYANTLHQRHEGSVPSETEATDRAEAGLRAPWFWVSCCPTNVARMLASAELYFATTNDNGVQLHQYGTYAIDTRLPDGRAVALSVESGYPFDGSIRVTVDGDEPVDFALTLRIPAWSVGSATLTVAGQSVKATERTVTIERTFSAGDVVELTLAMNPRFIEPHPRIDAARGQIAVERGPLVLCLESPDLPAGFDTEHVVLERGAGIAPLTDGARVSLRGVVKNDESWPYKSSAFSEVSQTFTAELHPYFGWANRGPSTMRVWIPLL
jgi:uncharacterized protein